MNGSSLYERNAAALAARFPELREALAKAGAPEADETGGSPAERVVSDSGEPTLRAGVRGNRVLLHSSRNPREEAKRFAGTAVDGREELLLVVGFGLGYHVEELACAAPESVVAVFEPSPGILGAALASRDFAPLFRSGRFFLSADLERWLEPWEAELAAAGSSVKLLVHGPYRALFPETVRKAEDRFFSLRNTREINLATLRRFDRLWTRNTFKNSLAFFTRPGLSALEGSLAGLPAVVVSAGPSLERDLGPLASLRERAVLIAVDSVLCPLLRRGTVPDFVVTVDPQLVNGLFAYELGRFAGQVAPTALPVLVADPAVHPVALRAYRGGVLLSSSVFPPGKVVERFSGKKGSIAAGGSVSVAAFDLARVLGADPIVLLGLDLSYPGARTHVSGSLVETHILGASNRLDTPLTVYARVVRSGHPVLRRGRDGKTVVTDRRMLLYGGWFERHGRESGARVVNATGGGLPVPGIPDVPLGSILEELGAAGVPVRDRVRRLREDLFRKGREPEGPAPEVGSLGGRGLEAFIVYLDRAVENLARVAALSGRARSLAEGFSSRGAGSSGGVEALGKLDGEILAFEEEARLLSMVMQGSITEVLENRGAGGGADVFSGSRRLYAAIEEGSRYLAAVLGSAKKRLMKTL